MDLVTGFRITLTAAPGARPDSAHLALSIIPCILLTLLPASALAQDDFLRFEAAPCPLPAPADVECGYLVVWEDRADPADGTIRLPIAILPSDTYTRKSLPVLATLLVHANLCAQKRGGWLKQPAQVRARDLACTFRRGSVFVGQMIEKLLGIPLVEAGGCV